MGIPLRATPRDDAKVRYHAYRAQAQRWAAQATNGTAWATIGAVSVPDHAEVREVEDGAFVEAVVWVPRGAVEDK